MWRKLIKLIQKFNRMNKEKTKSKFHWILDAGHGGLHPDTGMFVGVIV